MSHDPAQTPTPDFPRLTPSNHRVTSPHTRIYNCVAWAAGEDHRWWEPGRYWPCPVASGSFNVTDVMDALCTVGYQACPGGDLEAGYEKVAVYADGFDDPTHASRQLPDG